MKKCKSKRFISVVLSSIMVLTLIPSMAFAEETATKNKLITAVEVNCSVPSEGQRLDTIVLTVTDNKELVGLTAADFTLKGKAYGWSSKKEDGFKSADTHDFTANISDVKINPYMLTLTISDFTEKYFYVDSFTVTCTKNSKLTFSKTDVTKEATAVADEFKRLTFKSKDSKTDLAYNLFTPKDANGKQPLVVSLHGSGDQMNTLANRVAVAWAEPQAQKNHPAYVLAPVFSDQDPEVLKATVKQIGELVKQLIKDGKIDPNRVYVTGKSMGGGNTVRLAAENTDIFAAALPLCPSGERFKDIDVTVLKNMPIWFVQATNDKAVPIQGTRDVVKKIQSAGNKEIKFTEYTPEQMTERGILPDKHHDVEIISLEDGAYADWLFSQKLK